MRIDRVHIVLLKFALALIVHVINMFPGDATGSSTCFLAELRPAVLETSRGQNEKGNQTKEKTANED